MNESINASGAAPPERESGRQPRDSNRELPESRVVTEVDLISGAYPISRVRWWRKSAHAEG